MAEPVHSWGPTCAYYDEDQEEFAATSPSGAPPVKAQFFYVSSLPIDDPLSPLPPIHSEKATTKQPPQPFSIRDNAALEEAWQAFYKEGEPQGSPGAVEHSASFRRMYSFPKFQSGTGPCESRPPELPSTTESSDGTRTRSRPHILRQEAEERPKKRWPDRSDSSSAAMRVKGAAARTRQVQSAGQRSPGQPVWLAQGSEDSRNTTKLIDAEELGLKLDSGKTRKEKRGLSPFHRDHKSKQESAKTSPERDAELPKPANPAFTSVQQSSQPSSDISGRPFARTPSKTNIMMPLTDGAEESDQFDAGRASRDSPHGHSRSPDDRKREKMYVAVGVSRLHLVEMPDLVMKPIYWNPINDESSVIRATWFFKETMLPVPAEVANRLELGYEDIRPYVDSYQDELDACVANGAVAELKIVRKLWPEDPRRAGHLPRWAQKMSPQGQLVKALPRRPNPTCIKILLRIPERRRPLRCSKHIA